jgi:hypothetical protein
MASAVLLSAGAWLPVRNGFCCAASAAYPTCEGSHLCAFIKINAFKNNFLQQN